MKILTREISGSKHTVAGKITAVDFQYILPDGTSVSTPTADQLADIQAVKITITGATDATKTGRAAYSE